MTVEMVCGYFHHCEILAAIVTVRWIILCTPWWLTWPLCWNNLLNVWFDSNWLDKEFTILYMLKSLLKDIFTSAVMASGCYNGTVTSPHSCPIMFNALINCCQWGRNGSKALKEAPKNDSNGSRVASIGIREFRSQDWYGLLVLGFVWWLETARRVTVKLSHSTEQQMCVAEK